MITGKTRGQVSLEYLIMLAVLLAALLPLVWIATQNTEYATTTTEISSALDIMTSTADAVYSLGPGSERTVRLYLPGAYEQHQAAIYGKEIIIPYYIGGKFQEAYRSPTAEVKGNPPTGIGIEYLKFTMTEDGYVLIGGAQFVASPAYIAHTMVPSSSSINDIDIENVRSEEGIIGLSIIHYGNLDITLSKSSMSLNKGQNDTLRITINEAPSESGVYTDYVSIQDSTTFEEYAWIPVRVRIT